MDLMCRETASLRRAYEDPDDCVLNNLLATENKYQPTYSYFKCVQTDIKPYMREMVAEWMLEVCGEQQCEEEVFPLAMNYIDRFLSVVDTPRTRLQLLGTVAMFLASKLKETNPLPVEKLLIYTDNSVTLEDIIAMEMLVLNNLKWDLFTITPHDFLEQILSRISMENEVRTSIKRQTQMFIALCSKDCKFMMYPPPPPSMIAAGSLAAAHVSLKTSCHKLLENLHQILGIDIDYLRLCQEEIKQTLTSNLSNVENPVLETPLSSKTDCHPITREHIVGQPTTPTDVQDIFF